MKDRLKIAKDLLKDDGVIFVQCDDNEQAYLKVLMDEIFGRENYISTITAKSKTSSGVGQESYIFDICEYILVYAKNSSLAINHKPFSSLPLEKKTMDNYCKLLINFGIDTKIGVLSGGNVGDIEVFNHDDYVIQGIKKEDKNSATYYNYFKKIFRTTNPQGGLMKRIIPQIPQKGLVSVEYIPSKGKRSGEKYRYYFLNGGLVVWLKDSAIEDPEKKEILKLEKQNNLWIENLNQGIAAEGGVTLTNGKKSEKLIEQIISLSTKESDIVLDFFAGSGTTLAVAHKMNRKWIGVEQLKSHIDKCKERLLKVVTGEDTGGISKKVNWSGGGSFITASLAKYNEKWKEKILNLKDDTDLAEFYLEMKKKSVISYRAAETNLKTNLLEDKEFLLKPLEEKQKNLIDILDKNYMYVPLNHINDEDFEIPEIDKKLNKDFYGSY